MNTMILQEPTFLTDRQGNTLSAVVPIEQYNELLRIAELYEELEDLQLYYESKADPTPADPADIVFKRIEARRKIILC
jgi:hypothetical protein